MALMALCLLLLTAPMVEPTTQEQRLPRKQAQLLSSSLLVMKAPRLQCWTLVKRW
jgi:hypothetical protein